MRKLIVCVLVLLLAACGRGKDDLQTWMEHEAKSMKRGVPPIPEVKPFPLVEYSSEALVDPFSATRLIPETRGGAGGGLRPNLDRPREPLEAYPLESLKFVGVLERKGIWYAIILADKVLHQIRVGNFLGQNFGVVTKINEGEVDLKELVQDSAGEWVERDTTLMLQEREAK